MTITPRFTFGDFKSPTIVGVESMTFLLSRGARPSVCQVTLPYNPNLSRGPHPMVISDGFRSVRFRDCIVNDVQVIDSGGQTMSIVILDRRWKWEYPKISGQYNVRKAGGAFITGVKKSVRELAELCLLALGEKKSDIDLSRMPDDIHPYVNWDYEAAAGALETLCRMANSHVCLGFDDKVRVFRDGVGNELPELPSTTKSLGFEFGHKPGYVGIASGLFRWQFDFPLYPVGVEVDGSVKPIDELSYAPKIQVPQLNSGGGFSMVDGDTVDWGRLNPITLAGLSENVRDLAISTIWRWYKVGFPTQLKKQNNYMPMTKGKDSDGVKLETIEQLLPLLSEQISYVPMNRQLDRITFSSNGYEEKSRERKPAQVWGRFILPTGNGSQNIKEDAFTTNVNLDFYEIKGYDPDDGSVIPTEAMKEIQKYIFKGGFSVDWERGIVMFADPVILSKKADRLSIVNGKVQRITPKIVQPAKLFLRTACNFRDSKTRAGYRWGYKAPLKNAPDKNLVLWTVREDIIPEWRRDFGNGEGKDVSNIKDVETQQKYYLKHEAERFESRIPGNINVPQLLLFGPDGKIAQVVFEIDSEGFMSTTINKEIEGLNNMPDYRQRQIELINRNTQDLLARSQGSQDPQLRNARK